MPLSTEAEKSFWTSLGRPNWLLLIVYHRCGLGGSGGGSGPTCQPLPPPVVEQGMLSCRSTHLQLDLTCSWT